MVAAARRAGGAGLKGEGEASEIAKRLDAFTRTLEATEFEGRLKKGKTMRLEPRLRRLERTSCIAKPEPATNGDDVWRAAVVMLDKIRQKKCNGSELTPREREFLEEMGQ